MSVFKVGEVFIIEFADRVGHEDKQQIRKAIWKLLRTREKPTMEEYNFYSKYVGGTENKSELWKESMRKFEE
jgi:hypothetical protein